MIRPKLKQKLPQKKWNFKTIQKQMINQEFEEKNCEFCERLIFIFGLKEKTTTPLTTVLFI